MWRVQRTAFVSLLMAPFFVCAPFLAYAQEEYTLLTSHAIIALTNAERKTEMLNEYRENKMLAVAAKEKAQDMATRGYFSHATPEGEKTWNRVRDNGYVFSRVGENLAVKFSDPTRIVSSWMASPGHRANLLNEKFVDVGIGLAEGVYQGATTTFVVALFATPATEVNAGEVKGEQEPAQESAGLMASFEPEPAQAEREIAKTDETKTVTVEDLAPRQQVAAVSAGPDPESIFERIVALFRMLWSVAM
jgi:uncharacterized protein YkwD